MVPHIYKAYLCISDIFLSILCNFFIILEKKHYENWANRAIANIRNKQCTKGGCRHLRFDTGKEAPKMINALMTEPLVGRFNQNGFMAEHM
jgi:hypothetical protein